MEEVRTILQINIGSVKSSLQNDQDNIKMALNNKIVAMTTRMRDGIDSVKSSLVKDVEETAHMLRGEVNYLISIRSSIFLRCSKKAEHLTNNF